MAADNEETTLAPSVYEFDLEYDKAIVGYKALIESLEEEQGGYAEALIGPLLGLGRSYLAVYDYDNAEEALTRAQHLTHRHDGVYSPRQLEIIDLLTRLHLAKGKPMLADKQQRFSYFVSEHIYGAESPDILPAIDKLATWYTDTGQLYRARKTNEKGRDLIQKLYGETSLEQLPYMVELAKLKRLQRVCCSSKVMEEALALVAQNDPRNEVAAEAYINAGDAYIISGDEDQASEYYQIAWQKMNPAQREIAFATPHRIASSKPLNRAEKNNIRMFAADPRALDGSEFRELSLQERLMLESLPPQEFFLDETENEYNIRIRDRSTHNDFLDEPAMRTVGEPFKFLHKQLIQILPARFQTDANLNKLELDIVFSVDEAGNAGNIQINSINAPGKLIRMMREVVRKTRFRPRMENGVIVPTEHHHLRQTFHI